MSLADATFIVAGEFGPLDSRTLSGTLTIDTEAGIVTGIDVHITGSRPKVFELLNHSQGGHPSFGYYTVSARDTVTGDFLSLVIPSPDGGTSLRGYSGGLLFSASNRWAEYAVGSWFTENIWTGGSPLGTELLFGELTPLVVPEPGSLTLGGLAALFLAGYAARVRRQRRRADQN